MSPAAVPPIDVIDWLGHHWQLRFTRWIWREKVGFIEAWFRVVNMQPYELRDYDAICVPVFREWWPQ